MTGTLAIYRTTIGKKVIMAVTGFIWVGFVVVHMLGNLKLYLGAEHINAYGEFLRTVGEPALPRTGLLWIARLVLIAAVGLHVFLAYQLSMQSMAGRSSRYKVKKVVQATFASQTMRYGGIAILLFIVFHLLDLTLGVLNPRFIDGNPYNNVVASFSNPLTAGVYIVAMIALGLHLYHGTWSMFQTLGLNNRRYNGLFRGIATAVALIVAIGNISFPIAVLAGIVG